MKLATIDSMVQALRTRDLTDVRDTLDTAMEQVTLALQGLLHTSFEYAEATDYFRLSSWDDVADRDSLKLRLHRGFVVDPGAVQIVQAPTVSDLAENLPLDPSCMVKVHAKPGFVEIFPTPYQVGHCFKVTYQAGFQPMASPQEDVYAGVPHELHNLAIAYGFEVYQAIRNWNSDTGRAGYKAVSGVRLPVGVVNPMIPSPSPGIYTLIESLSRDSAVGIDPFGSI